MEKQVALFINSLEEKYGSWNRSKALFGYTPYGKIASDLSISNSQFSKLLYGTGTLGMYERTLKNINRLVERQAIESAYDKSQKTLSKSSVNNKKRILIFSLIFFFLGIAFSYYFKLINPTSNKPPYSDHPLEEYFYPSSTKYFDSPFLNNSDVLDNCPCAGFEGRWSLNKPYKLPLPGTKKPGLYYQGKFADLILRCSNLFDSHIDNGNALIGYEHVKSEIWIDTQEENIVPKYFNSDLKKFTNKFDELIFENEKRFVKVADLSGFNVNMFEISGDSITRRAELSGRLSLDVNDELAQEYTIDIAYITKNILGDLIKTQCETIYNPYCDPNNLSDGSQLSFKCLYTIGEENLGLEGGYPYTKTFSFKNQVYSDYISCDCDK